MDRRGEYYEAARAPAFATVSIPTVLKVSTEKP